MAHSSMITLLAEPPKAESTPSGFTLSVVLHLVAVAVFTILHLVQAPRLVRKEEITHYSVRYLETPEPKTARSQAGSYFAPRGQPAKIETAPGSESAGGSREAAAVANVPELSREVTAPAPAPPPLPVERVGRQTLIQPAAPDVPLPQLVRLPTVAMLSPAEIPRPVIVPQARPVPNEAAVQPVPELPNNEQTLASIKLAASKAEAPLLTASTTSPLVIPSKTPPAQPPQTITHAVDLPAPATVVSISDAAPQAGTVPIPMARQSAPANQDGKRIGTGTAASNGQTSAQPSGNGRGDAAQKSSGTSSGSTAGKIGSGAKSATDGGAKGAGGNKPGADGAVATVIGSGDKVGGGHGPAAAGATANGGDGRPVEIAAVAGPEDGSTVRHVSAPKDGQFGVVVVNSSIADEYPETVPIWAGRLVYSVYLHLGIGKNWILQYSVPREALAGAGVARPEAAWPYEMFRPKLTSADFSSDAIMVHGFVNEAGHFERLAMVVPSDFSRAEELIRVLGRWQFRPARTNGHVAMVEILLIIPAED